MEKCIFRYTKQKIICLVHNTSTTATKNRFTRDNQKEQVEKPNKLLNLITKRMFK